MKKNEQTIKWVLSELSDLSVFSEEFRSYCEQLNLDENKIFELELSLEELIVNSFTHGYKEAEEGSVAIEAEDVGALNSGSACMTKRLLLICSGMRRRRDWAGKTRSLR